MEQRQLVELALSEQHAIGWDLCFRGYLSRHWALAVAARPSLPMQTPPTTKHLDTGKIWAQKTVCQLWEFGREMWLHRNSILHDSTIEECCQMKGAATNAEITALYDNVDSYAAEGRW
jgi:hypothetical protein